MADDTKVVQMQFDNKDFEKNIAKSQSSLEKFKASLNFDAVGKSLKTFGNNVKNLTFETLSNNVQKLTDKFTGLGDAGEYVLSRLRRSMEGLALQAEQFVKSMTMDQISVGQNKYDALTKSVQTIVASGSATEEKAYSVMERVMEYTNQTSHSFETMVSQISSLTSIGVPLEKAEKLMEGFANASSKAGADASHAAIAMMTYSKAMGSYLTKNEFDTLNLTAKVVTKEWREELIAAGIAAGDLEKDTKGVIKTAKKYGKQVTVTADNLESTLSKKWATKKTMSILGERYMFGDSIEDLKHPEDAADSFGKTAYLTGQRALTFADGLNAVKEAISGGWMTSFRLIFGDLTDAMNLWTGSCNRVIDALSGLSDARNAILETWKNLGGRDSLIKMLFGEMEDTQGNTLYEGAYGIIDVLEQVGNMISEAFWHTFMNLIPKDAQDNILAQVNGNLDLLNKGLVAMGRGDLVRDTPFESFEELFNSEFFRESGGRNGMFGGFLEGVTTSIQEFVQGINDWFNEVDVKSGLSRIQKIQNVLDAIGRTIAFVAEVGGGLIHFFEVLGDENHLGPSLKTIGDTLSSLGLSITSAENDASNAGSITAFFDSLAEVVKPACELVNLVVESLGGLATAMVQGEDANQNFGNVLVKIGDIFKSVFGTIVKIATPVAGFIAEVNGILGDLFKDGFSEQGIKRAKERFSVAFAILWNELKVAFGPILQEISAFFKLLWEEIKTRATAYFNDPSSLGHKILEPIKKVLEFLQPVFNILKAAWESVKGIFMQGNAQIQGITLFDTLKAIFASESVTKLVNKLRDLAKDGGLYKLIMAALGGIFILRAIKMMNAIGGFFSDVGGNLKAGIFGTYEWFSEKIQGIAKGILMLAAAVALLGNMDTGAVIQGLLAMGIIMLEFVMFTHLMNTLNAATLMQQMALTGVITAFCGALMLLVLSLLPFAFVSWGGLVRMIGGLALVLATLIGFMFLMQKLQLSTLGLSFKGIVAFTFAISILITSLIPFMIADWQAMLRGVAGLALVLLDLIGFMELMKVLGLSTFGLGFAGIAKFALAVGILMFSLVPFMIADWKAMLRGVIGLAVVLAELIGFMELMKVLGLSTYGLGFAGIAKFGLAVAILMFSMIPFMIADWESMLRAVIGLGLVLAELIGFMSLMRAIGLSTFGLNFAGMAGFTLAIGILMVSLLPFMNTNWEGMLRAVIGLGLVLAELIGFMTLMKAIGLSTFGLSFAGIVAFSAAIAILILSLQSFAGMDWGGWARAVAGLTVILAEIALFMIIAQAISFNPTAIAMVVAVCLGIGAMALLLSMAMNEVRNLKWEVVTAFMAGMTAAILAMAVAIAMLSVIPFGAGLKGIALLAIGVAAIVGVIALMAPMLIGSLGDSLTSLSAKLELLSGMLKGFTDRMGSIDMVNMHKAETIFDQLKRILEKLAGWGKFTGDLNNFTYSMFALGTGMEIFNNHVGNAITDLDSNAQAALKFIQDLSGCAGDLDTISKMNVNNLIVAIANLGGAMSLYAYGAKEVAGLLGENDTPDQTTVDAAIKILQAISTGIAEAGGFTIPEDMPAEQELALFGSSLAALAGALVQFEAAGSGLGMGTERALACLDFFRDLKDKLTTTEFRKNLGTAIGIFKSNGVDTNDLTTFGANIEQLGLAMKAFNESVTILDEQTGERHPIDFSNPIATLDSLVALQGKLGLDFGPVIQFFAGRRKDFTDLGAEIEALGTAISDFINKVGGVDENTGEVKFDTTMFDKAIEVADKVADYLIKLGWKMGGVGGLAQLIMNAIPGRDYNFTDLKTQMTALAEGIGSLGQLKIEDKLITVDDTTGIFAAVDKIIDYLKELRGRMNKVGGYVNITKTFWFGRDYNFTDLKQQLVDLGAGLNGLSAFEVKDLPTKEELENNAFPAIDALIDYMNELKGKISADEGKVGGLINFLNHATLGEDYNFTHLKDQLTAIGDGLNSLASVSVDTSGKSIFNAEGRGAALDTMDALILYMQGLGSKLGLVGGLREWLNTMWEGKAADFEYLGTQLGFLGDGLGKFQAGITAHGSFDASQVDSALGALDHLVSMMQTFSVLSKSMDAISQSYGLSSYTTQNLVQNMVNALHQMTGVFELEGHAGPTTVVAELANFIKEFDYQLAELGGLDNANSVDILQGVAMALTNLTNAARDMQDGSGNMTVNFRLIGSNICTGIILGIQDGQSGVISAAVTMATSAYEAAKAALGIQSPSRIFAELGMYVGEGLVQGINHQQGNVALSAEGLADSAVDGAVNALAAFASLMSQDIDANPTITPVLDLSNIRAGSDAIRGMLSGDQAMSLAGAGGDYSAWSIPTADHSGSEHQPTDLSGVYASIQGLGDRISAMADRISNLQIVMNTGALVGEVTDGVNKALGAKTTYNRRRN